MDSDLVSLVDKDRRMFIKAVSVAFDRSIELAEADDAYQEAKNRRTLELKDEGVPATIIQLTIKGDPEVRPLYTARNKAQSAYDSANKAIDAYKLSARLLEAQLQREWGMAGGL